MKTEIFLYKYIWNKFPSLRPIIKRLIHSFADTLIRVNKTMGNSYVILFKDWGVSWFDHRFDYLRGVSNYHWMERAFYALDKIQKGDEVLDIGCGDGSFDGIFFADKAKRVMAIDRDQIAILHARKYYKRDNVDYYRFDITKKKLPKDKFNVILMFAVIEHFSKLEGLNVLRNIKFSMKKDGVFFGSTPIFKILGKSNWEHENEFTSKKQLKIFLSEVFSKVKIRERGWAEGRRECYFECKA